MGKYLDLDDVVADNPEAKKELAQLRKSNEDCYCQNEAFRQCNEELRHELDDRRLRVRELEAQLKDANGRYIRGGDGSHWDGCEETHWDCKIAKLERENAELRKAIITYKSSGEFYTKCPNCGLCFGARAHEIRAETQKGG
jgi:hypothetical protein